MRNIIYEILERPVFAERPPVLMDVGASGALPPQWDLLAPYSICLAFDADQREMHSIRTDSRFKALHVLGAALHATAQEGDRVPFYLTRSPFCSSLLEPDSAALADWSFADLFEVESVVQLPAVSPSKALADNGVQYVDWYKSDSQGLDLTLYMALPAAVRERILVLEFEPGILNAYKGEDKLHSIMRHMEPLPYWLESMTVRGPERLDRRRLRRLAPRIPSRPFEYGGAALPSAPGWAEVRYVSALGSRRGSLSERDLLLAVAFGVLRGQHGYALEGAELLIQQFPSTDNERLLHAVIRRMSLFRGRRFLRRIMRRLAALLA